MVELAGDLYVDKAIKLPMGWKRSCCLAVGCEPESSATEFGSVSELGRSEQVPQGEHVNNNIKNQNGQIHSFTRLTELEFSYL